MIKLFITGITCFFLGAVIAETGNYCKQQGLISNGKKEIFEKVLISQKP